MTTTEENEIRRLCLRITREANIVSQPYAMADRRKAVAEMLREVERVQRILGSEKGESK